MTIPSVTGSITQIQNSGTSPSQSVSIPADAVLCLFLSAHWIAGGGLLSSASLDGNAFTHINTVDSSSAEGVTAWRYIIPGAMQGTSKTLAWTWASALTEGANIFVVFLKDVDTSGDPIRDSDIASSSGTGTSTTPAFSTDVNDLCMCIVGSFSSTDADAGVSGQTEIADSTEFNGDQGAVGSKNGSAGTTTMAGSGADRAVVGFSIKGIAAVVDQEGFRFGIDDGSESAHTWADAQDTSISTADNLTRLIRALLNTTGDQPATAFKLKFQKNGTGGYGTMRIGSTYKAVPVIEAGDTTSSGDNNTTPTSPWPVSRPTAATGDLLIMIIGWDDSTTNTGVSVANGPNGEVWSQINSVVASASTEVRMTAYYVVATGAWGAGSISVTPNANEQWTATVIKVLAGEFDAAAPIGASNTRASAGTAETDALSPSLTAGASDGGGRLIWAVTTDTDPLVTLQSGNTSIANNDRGNEALGVAIRDTEVSDSESIAGGATWSLAGDSWCSITFVVRAPTVNNDIYITTSANIAPGGEDTTARLTAPSGKTTSDFVTGRRWDDENGTDTIDITTDDYTEVEWCIALKSGLVNADYFDMRVYAGDSALSTYTVTPRWTVSTGVTGNPWNVYAQQ